MKKIINALCMSLLIATLAVCAKESDEAVSKWSTGAVPYKDQDVLFGVYNIKGGPDIFGPLVSVVLDEKTWNDDIQVKNDLKNIEINSFGGLAKISEYIKTTLQGPYLGESSGYEHRIKLFIWEMNPAVLLMDELEPFNFWRLFYGTDYFEYYIQSFDLEILKYAQEVRSESYYTVITLPPWYYTEYNIATAFWTAFKKTSLMKGANITQGLRSAPVVKKVKAIDENIDKVTGFLPYYYESKSKLQNLASLHILVGNYSDLTLGDFYSAPVEIEGLDRSKFEAVSQQFFGQALANNKYFHYEYEIGQKKKTYDLQLIEISEEQMENLKKSLIAKRSSGFEPAPRKIVDLNVNNYLGRQSRGSRLIDFEDNKRFDSLINFYWSFEAQRLGYYKEGGVVTNKAKGYGVLIEGLIKEGDVEMVVTKGFGEAFFNMTYTIGKSREYFLRNPNLQTPIKPVIFADPVADSLIAFADALNKLAPQIK